MCAATGKRQKSQVKRRVKAGSGRKTRARVYNSVRLQPSGERGNMGPGLFSLLVDSTEDIRASPARHKLYRHMSGFIWVVKHVRAGWIQFLFSRVFIWFL